MKGIQVLVGLVILFFVTTMAIPSSSVSSGSKYNPWADINNDGKVNLEDLMLLALSYGTAGTPLQKLSGNIVAVYFSPNGGCEQAVVNWINEANSTIHILIYDFTLAGIAQALINAQQRGVAVQVVFDKSQIRSYSMYWTLQSAGIQVRNDTNKAGIMHNKVMIVDGYVILTGSFNWSISAEKDNNENLVVLDSTVFGADYEGDFSTIWNAGV